VLGFLLVYVLNENERLAIHMRPRFVALFACVLAIAVGVVWEIFEFAMDQLFGMQMQKPSIGDASGLTDTMSDLIVNAIAAMATSGFGWRYMLHGERSFVARWNRQLSLRRPRLFLSRRRASAFQRTDTGTEG
jgi:uncharacterized membrane protein YjdF